MAASLAIDRCTLHAHGREKGGFRERMAPRSGAASDVSMFDVRCSCFGSPVATTGLLLKADVELTEVLRFCQEHLQHLEQKFFPICTIDRHEKKSGVTDHRVATTINVQNNTERHGFFLRFRLILHSSFLARTSLVWRHGSGVSRRNVNAS